MSDFKKKGLKDYIYKKNSTEMYSLLETYASRENAINGQEYKKTLMERFDKCSVDWERLFHSYQLISLS